MNESSIFKMTVMCFCFVVGATKSGKQNDMKQGHMNDQI